MISILIVGNNIQDNNYISLPVARTDVQGKLGLYLEDILRNQTDKNRSERAIYLSHSKGEAFVGVKNILFAEVRNKICSISTTEGVFEIYRKSLSDVIGIVDDAFFLRCHRGFALNVRQLKGIEKIDRRIWRAVFENGSGTCLISSSFLDTVMGKYRTIQVK